MHLPIFISSCLHIFAYIFSSCILAYSHLHILHLPIHTSSYSHLHILSLHLHIFTLTSSHLHTHIFTSEHTHIFTLTSSHLHIWAYLHLHIFTSEHTHIFSFSLSFSLSSLSLSPFSLSFLLFLSLFRPRAVPARSYETSTLSHEMRVDAQKLRKNCDFTCAGATVPHEMRVDAQKLW